MPNTFGRLLAAGQQQPAVVADRRAAAVRTERKALALRVEDRQHCCTIAERRHDQRRLLDLRAQLGRRELLQRQGDDARLGLRLRSSRDLTPDVAPVAAQAAHAIDPSGSRADVARTTG